MAMLVVLRMASFEASFATWLAVPSARCSRQLQASE